MKKTIAMIGLTSLSMFPSASKDMPSLAGKCNHTASPQKKGSPKLRLKLPQKNNKPKVLTPRTKEETQIAGNTPRLESNSEFIVGKNLLDEVQEELKKQDNNYAASSSSSSVPLLNLAKADKERILLDRCYRSLGFLHLAKRRFPDNSTVDNTIALAIQYIYLLDPSAETQDIPESAREYSPGRLKLFKQFQTLINTCPPQEVIAPPLLTRAGPKKHPVVPPLSLKGIALQVKKRTTPRDKSKVNKTPRNQAFDDLEIQELYALYKEKHNDTMHIIAITKSMIKKIHNENDVHSKYTKLVRNSYRSIIQSTQQFYKQKIEVLSTIQNQIEKNTTHKELLEEISQTIENLLYISQHMHKCYNKYWLAQEALELIVLAEDHLINEHNRLSWHEESTAWEQLIENPSQMLEQINQCITDCKKQPQLLKKSHHIMHIVEVLIHMHPSIPKELYTSFINAIEQSLGLFDIGKSSSRIQKKKNQLLHQISQIHRERAKTYLDDSWRTLQKKSTHANTNNVTQAKTYCIEAIKCFLKILHHDAFTEEIGEHLCLLMHHLLQKDNKLFSENDFELCINLSKKTKIPYLEEDFCRKYKQKQTLDTEKEKLLKFLNELRQQKLI